ncbi:hypothetical protein CONCODRAFT_17246 [Conidiobolus coronatus NRRL 28638]|uniref:Uncharacterized protein n=1 Tax=Conidiobolus coronatus (strain ATCC 28846 / CBS 209.66 / NRRL 28638) TaxID=796925 RepID=A0A137P7L2_CONC2|nr:hypothetical protein CONCODRAFT_17246 [Conidiobolus coronatus NRRL 28638]|eukprot:KXN70982.1 hypothetical protein CONCODRAFT_17246 [Conidiobolus coronatus NRRL 28638]
MIKINKSALIKYYALFNVLSLLAYNLTFLTLPLTSSVATQLFISLNLIFASCYLIFIDNVVLNGGDYLKSFFVTCSNLYLLIWELVKLLGKSPKLTYFYSYFIYFGLIIVHLCFYKCCPKVFEKFIKFNYGFTWFYVSFFLLPINSYLIFFCSLSGIFFIYWKSVTLDYMTLLSTSMIYPLVLLEALISLDIVIFPDQDSTTWEFIAYCLGFIYMYLIKKMFFEKLKEWAANDAEDLERGNLRASTESASVSNYSTF